MEDLGKICRRGDRTRRNQLNPAKIQILTGSAHLTSSVCTPLERRTSIRGSGNDGDEYSSTQFTCLTSKTLR